MVSLGGGGPTQLARDMHGFLASLDPARLPTLDPSVLRQGLQRHARDATQVVHAWSQLPAPMSADRDLHAATRELATTLSSSTPRDAVTHEWLALRDRLAPLYEALVTALRRHGERVDTLHPTNHRRTAFHVLSGLAVIAAFQHVLTPATAVALAGSAAVVFWTLEVTRRRSPAWNAILMRLFRPIAREHERYRVNSSTWFCSALLLVAATVPNGAGMLGVMALAVGDPAAAWVGRRWGRRRVARGKSLEGAVAFVVVSLLGGAAYLAVYPVPGAGVGVMAAMAGAAALTGAAAELWATRVDDNFAIPLASGWAALAVWWLAGG